MWDVWIAGILGVIAGIAASWVAVHLQARQDRRHGPRQAVKAARAVELDRAVMRLRGYKADVSHSISHIRDGDREYVENLREISRNMRSFSREHSALLGDVAVSQVKIYTDQLMSELDGISGGASASETLVNRDYFLSGVLSALETGSYDPD